MNMHIFFSGIGGSAISALALIAQQAGYEVSGSDARPSQYLDYLRKHGVTNTYVGLSREQIASIHAKKPIDWYVMGSAQLMDFPDNEEYRFVKEADIKISKRDELLNKIIEDKNLKLIAVAGTHGKSTTVAMLIWLAKELGIKTSWSAGAKMEFADTGHYEPGSQYFIYEADEFDRNFLAFRPHLSIITGIDWDHPDIYPTRQAYYDAFKLFLDQSERVVLWRPDFEKLQLDDSPKLLVLDDLDDGIDKLKLVGKVNRLNAWLAAQAIAQLPDYPLDKNLAVLNRFPGLSRRFEKISNGLYSDYAHTPGKIRGALQLAHEVAGRNVVVIYEGLHNLRQHFIKDELKDLFASAKRVYVVPTYLGREDPKLPLLSPADLVNLLSKSVQQKTSAAKLDSQLKQNIQRHIADGDVVFCLTAGGPGSLDEWLRKEFGS